MTAKVRGGSRTPGFGGGRNAPARRAEIVCTGSELVAGRAREANAAWIARRLATHGIETSRVTLVPDDRAAVAAAAREALGRARVVVVTGGLGPTRDDVTRAALARATGRPLAPHPEALARLARLFPDPARRAGNRRQAYLPRGARPLANPVGTAPGVWLSLSGGRCLAAVPGVPREMRLMIDREVLPRLARGRPRAVRVLSVFGLPESEVDARVGRLPRGVRYAITVDGIRSRVALSAPAGRARRLAAVARILRRRLAGAAVVSGEATLARAALARLRARRETLAVAESCTGGRIAAALTAVPGASAVFQEGIVAYADAAKRRRLGVSAGLLRRFGAVSRPVALALARGARRRGRTDWGLSVTGVAGPGGGTPDKPVGLVWVGRAGPGGARARELRLRGDRAAVQTRAAERALLFLYEGLRAGRSAGARRRRRAPTAAGRHFRTSHSTSRQ